MENFSPRDTSTKLIRIYNWIKRLFNGLHVSRIMAHIKLPPTTIF